MMIAQTEIASIKETATRHNFPVESSDESSASYERNYADRLSIRTETLQERTSP